MFCNDITNRYYLIVSFVPSISYLIWGTVVYGVPWHWLGVAPKSRPVSFTRGPYACHSWGVYYFAVRTDQSKASKVGHWAR